MIAAKLPSMQALADKVSAELSAPYLQVVASDTLLADISIDLSFDRQEDWPHQQFHNSLGITITIMPCPHGKVAYGESKKYAEGDKLQVYGLHRTDKIRPFSKVIVDDIDGAIAEIKQWMSTAI